MEAAQELFEAHGYAATTIQQIAERADVAWQTVYATYGNKVAILSAPVLHLPTPMATG